nr:adhesion G protein-coupled receptor E1 [Misgurnus anguillicaudatus]
MGSPPGITSFSLLALTERVLMETNCQPGYIPDRRGCIDYDECEYEEPICGDNADCYNTLGSYYCQCQKGFTPPGNFTEDTPTKCEDSLLLISDINECMEYSIDCGPNASCHNTGGNYTCTCNDGYIANNNAETFMDRQGVQCIDRNECEEDSGLCGINARCHNTPGSYYCTCAPGFRLRSGQTNFTDPSTDSCETDICYNNSSICGEGLCKNGKDGHECVCKPGFTNFGHKQMKCTVDICYTDKSICGEGSCKNRKDGHECECKPGFTNYGHKQMKCTDRNECEDYSGLCGINARCHNTPGSYYCTCAPGFRLRSGQTNFTDPSTDSCETNICYTDKSICGEGSCKNSKDGHECVCKPGFTNNGNKQMKCTDINECEDYSGLCGINARCHNTPGSYYCTCAPGFRLRSGQTNFTDPRTDSCETDICYTDKSICGEGSCKNSKDGHECECKPGFTNYGHKQMKCTDRNECEDYSGLCGINARCHNTPGSYYCTCAPGFRLRSGQTNFTDPSTDSCETDICYTDKSICGEGSCKNSKDGHECECKPGFTNYGHKQMKCTDRNECEVSDLCGMNARCHNIPGSYYCTCAPGFRLRSGQTNFIDPSTDSCETDKCYNSKSICGEGLCKNSKDGHECVCKPGFTNHGHKQMKCTDRNECEDYSGLCGINATCNNTPGSYYCTCAPGFRLRSGQTNFTDPRTDSCETNICNTDKSICGEGSCKNGKDGHECICKPGFTNHGHKQMKCTDRNECKVDSGLCGINARCHNTPGSYYCTCAPGFRLRSGQTNFTDPSTDSCESICNIDTSICGEGSCKNGKDGHECECKSGFTNHGQKQMKCTVDICYNNTSICGEGLCKNSKDGHECECKPGFTNYGHKQMKCTVDICYNNTSICGEGSCKNSKDGHECVCKPGFTNYGRKQMKCTGYYLLNITLFGYFVSICFNCCCDFFEVDICYNNTSICGEGLCKNSKDGHECECKPGFTNYEHKQMKCTVDICYNNTSICGEGLCKNSKDGHECECKPGFTNYGHKQMKCTELKCDTCKNDFSKHPELTNITSLMTNTYLSLSEKKKFDAERFLKDFLDALDDLLSKEIKDAEIMTQIFDIVESMLKLIGPLLNNNQTKMSAKETEVELLVKRGSSSPDGPLMMSTNSTQFTSNWKTATGNTYLGFTTAALLGYKSLEGSLNSYFGNLMKQENMKYEINSKVVTVVVSNAETKHLQEPVNLTFSHLKQMNENLTCVFWDHELGHRGWSTRNCTKVRSDANETVCSCTHLSSFAVLMALYDIGDVYELRVITCVGLSISLICLLICIATFYLVRSIQCTRNTIHLHLCITLFIAYFIFLVGITRTENKVGCAIVAGMLHYFFLSAFCWMCLEGVQLFRMVVLVFNTTVRHIYLVAAGYGVPAVIVAISAAVNADGYGTEKHCWLNLEGGFIWSFYGPVCVIIIVNVFFFLITIWKLADKFSSLNPDLNNLRKIRAFTITAIAQLCVLGIMWVFGCFQFDSGTLAISYIFTILGSLQGVMMFVIHCCLSKQVRDEYVKYLADVCTPQKRKYSEFSSNQASKSQTSKSVQNTGESSI